MDSSEAKFQGLFQGLLEAAPDAIVGVDADGRIALVNAQTERLFGYHRDELVGQLVEMLVPEAARAVHPGHRNGFFQDPAPRPMGAGMQLAGRRKDGTEFPAEISLGSLATDDGILVSAAVRDVTQRVEAQAERERLKAQVERERLESQLHQSQRLESLGQLAGGVAHDFNNLIGAILNYASFIAKAVTPAVDGPDGDRWATVLDDVKQIERAADRAAGLTHQLLAFGRREVVQPRVLNLNEVVSSVEQLLHRTIGEHVELVTSLHPEIAMIMADQGQIEQILVNLAINARDAMSGGGRLEIDTEDILVDEHYAALRPMLNAGPYVRLRVSDTGSGMDHDTIAHAFEPFFTTKPKGEGSGLGLATVYGIVTQAGGHIQIYSEAGIGTTITMLFPTTDEAPTHHEQTIPTRQHRGGETILVVEDEAIMRDVTSRILTDNGHVVLTAASGHEAIELVNGHDGSIELLLTDVVMPQMLGKEVAERIRMIRPGLRVLFMSGYAQPVLASQGTLDAGVYLVEKPFTETTLLAKIREVLDEPNGP